MKQTVVMLTVALTLIGLAAAVQGQRVNEFRVAPSFGMLMGDTRYELNTEDIRSELIFPLDVNLIGGELSWKLVTNGRADWSARLSLMTAINDPGDKFTDKDWLKVDGFGLVEFSSTESTVEASVLSFEVELARLLAVGEKRRISALVGFGYQKVKQEAIDIAGMQSNPTDSGVIVYQFDIDTLALTYEVRYLRPYFGLMPEFMFGPTFSAALALTFSPLVHAKDIDDHVLRYFQTRSDGTGFGFGGRLTLLYESTGPDGSPLSVRFQGFLNRDQIDVTGRREYYAHNDEGYEVGDGFPQGTTITSLQYGARLLVGLRF